MRLLLLSRNAFLYSTGRLVRAARARGHDVEVIDPLELQIAVLRRRPALLRGGRRLGRFDAVIPRIGVSITRYGMEVVSQLELAGTVALNGAEAIGCSRDKLRALQLLVSSGIRVPRTVCTRSLAGLDGALALVGGCPVVVKLQQGAQGIGTMIADTPQALRGLIETLWAMGQEIVLQQYVGEAAGNDLRALVVGGSVVAAMRRVARPGEFRSNLHRGGTGDPVQLPPRYRRCAIAAAGLVGLEVAGVDMLETPNGPLVVELNSSPGLEGIERASNVDVAAAVIALAEELVAPARRGRRRARGARS
ncbi:MAG: RimK family alpha-L-glutamate ligase [Deltaproteobacteria bacterium]|nr:RimK family alpha-L-glutamate ligase [Deltaproteobacteria bacterium]